LANNFHSPSISLHFFQKYQIKNILTFLHFLYHINNFFIIIQIKKLTTKQIFFTFLYNILKFYITSITFYYTIHKYSQIQLLTKQARYVVTINHILKYSCTPVNVSTLSNHVNLCFNFFLLSLFDFILFIIIVHDNNIMKHWSF
jgi:hypothetical protein